jgi:hypothetical protein
VGRGRGGPSVYVRMGVCAYTWLAAFFGLGRRRRVFLATPESGLGLALVASHIIEFFYFTEFI